MRKWLEFLKERLPLHVLLLSSIGLSGSSQALTAYPLTALSVGLGTLLAFIFFLTMRIMDEVKDYKKDQVAHPERPLPRGLISLAAARKAVACGLLFCGLAAGAAALLDFPLSAGLFAVSSLYLFLMYKEFYVSRWLEERVLLYTFSHQLVIIFLTAALASLAYPQLSASLDLLLLQPGVLFLGIFLVYEVARKLDPDAHPLLLTYRLRFGVQRTGHLLNFACLITLAGISLNRGPLGLGAYLLAAGPVLIVLLYPRFVVKNHKVIEGIAGLWLLLVVWTPYIARLIP